MQNLSNFNNYFMQKVLPLVYDESLSYYEVLSKLINFINNLITDVNNLINNNNELQKKYGDFLKSLDNLSVELQKIKDGNYIKDGSITKKKLSNSVFTEFNQYILDTVYKSAKFVTFGINEEGYFFADIPRSFKDIVFSTDVEGRLILNY